MKFIDVPHPPRMPFIGNAHQLQGKSFLDTVKRFAQQYGPFFELRFPGARFYIASDFELVDEICDESRFQKIVGGPLKELQKLTGNALFTADSNDPEWELAHTILAPAFAMKAIRGYFPEMLQVGQSLLDSWKDKGSQPVTVTDDCTRMTLDTIALTGFGFHFHSFQSEVLHPFVAAMERSLIYALKRPRKTRLQLYFSGKSDAAFQKDRDLMFATVDEVIEQRQKEKNPRHDSAAQQPDMLSLMLDGVDRKTGGKLSPEMIRFQLITFLVAGHETTSGLLSFALYYLVKNPGVLAKVREEVDAIWEGKPGKTIEFADVIGLKNVTQVLKETLRLWPTAPGFSRTPLREMKLGGRFTVRPGDRIFVPLFCLHRDAKIWGDNFDQFDPERFSPAQVRERPDRAFRPFGTGSRMCIGQNFAMVEAGLTIALIVRNFELEDFENYSLIVRETLTLKPKDFRLKVHQRVL